MQNSSLLLILLGPVLCSILFFRLSGDKDFAKPRLGLVGSRQEGLGLILSTSDSVLVSSFVDEKLAREALTAGKVDGIIKVEPGLAEAILKGEFPSLSLEVSETESLRSKLLEKAVESSARHLASQDLPVDIQVKGLIEAKTHKNWTQGLLPSWLVFTAMSGLMFCSASIMEEKDQGTLLGVLTAPVSMVELWVGKLGSGFILSYLSTLAVLLGNSVFPTVYLLFHLAAGCLGFSALGIMVGLLCSNAPAANAVTSTLFMVVYIPLALQEMSPVFYRVASFTPAFYLQRGARYFMDANHAYGLTDFLTLLVFDLVLAICGFLSLKNTRRLFMGT